MKDTISSSAMPCPTPAHPPSSRNSVGKGGRRGASDRRRPSRAFQPGGGRRAEGQMGPLSIRTSAVAAAVAHCIPRRRRAISRN